MRKTAWIVPVCLLPLLCPPALAQPCLTAEQDAAFELVTLKSALMVGALSCGLSAPYNIFMTRFQPQLRTAQRAMDEYFMAAGGLAGRSLEDAFITQLANSLSGAAANTGPHFCDQAMVQFSGVLELPTADGLPGFAAAQPSAALAAEAPLCPGAAPPPAQIAAAPSADEPHGPLPPDQVPTAEKPLATAALPGSVPAPFAHHHPPTRIARRAAKPDARTAAKKPSPPSPYTQEQEI